MPEEPLVFKHVRGGKPFAASELPKLPPAAMRAILSRLKEQDDAGVSSVAMDMAVDIVAIALRRMDPSVSVEAIYEDEDYDMVQRAYGYIEKANPSIFPPAPGKKVVESPNAAGPA